jgi:hypothetical protein
LKYLYRFDLFLRGSQKHFNPIPKIFLIILIIKTYNRLLRLIISRITIILCEYLKRRRIQGRIESILNLRQLNITMIPFQRWFDLWFISLFRDSKILTQRNISNLLLPIIKLLGLIFLNLSWKPFLIIFISLKEVSALLFPHLLVLLLELQVLIILLLNKTWYCHWDVFN